MSSSDDKTSGNPPGEAPVPETDAGVTQASDAESRLEIAKRFLDEDTVKNSPLEKKVEFLRSKGLTDEEIESLLGQEFPQEAASSPKDSQPEQPHPQAHQEVVARPPIITYPEFLAKEPSPPLLSTNTLLNALYVLTGLTTLLHGTKRYYIDPSLSTQTTARRELSSATTSHLASLLSKLESTVSSIPPTTSPPDDASTCSDPTELFSRDVGTQTSPPPIAPTKNEPSPVESQAQKLDALSRRLGDLREGLDAQAENTHDAMAVADALMEKLREASVARSYAHLGWNQPEPDDEVKRVKENIRRLKGVFLSTRNFPVSTK